MKQPIPVKDKFLLTINEASEYFNIGQKNMRRIAEDHLDSFSIFQGNRYLIIRSRCEEYIISCLKTEEGGKTL
ncbi:MAG: DNA-binding protein [Oscillospiraceae bacterium]|nr:DNA-binding protein [Oscillospiraceae bacterium]